MFVFLLSIFFMKSVFGAGGDEKFVDLRSEKNQVNGETADGDFLNAMAKATTLILDTMIKKEKYPELWAQGIAVLHKYLKAACDKKNVVDWDPCLAEIKDLRKTTGEVNVAETSLEMHSTKYLAPLMFVTAGIFGREIIQLIFSCQKKAKSAEYSELLEDEA